MKAYEFNGQMYTNLNELALAFKDNYTLAMDNIYTNYKLLVKLIKAQTKDKELVERVRYYLAYSHSKNSALTFIIFELLDEKAVYINGAKLSFEAFCQSLKEFKDDKDNVLVNFLKDGGLEYTYSRMPEYENLKEDAVYLDVNSDKDTTIEYLINFYNQDDDIYSSYLADVIQGNEKFRRFNRLLKESAFITYLSHHYGFKEISKSLNDSSRTFIVAKTLAKISEYDEKDIAAIFDDTFYLWILDNYKNYKFYKKDAKALAKRFKDYRKEYRKLTSKISRVALNDKIAKKSDVTYFDLLMDLHSKLHEEYQYLVKFYHDGLVKTNSEAYMLEIPYADTYICREYQGNKMLMVAQNKFEDQVLDDNASMENVVDLDDTSMDFPNLEEVKHFQYDIERIKKNKAIQRKNSSLASFSIGFGVLIALLTILAPVLLYLLKDTLKGTFKYDFQIISNNDNVEGLLRYMIMGGGLLVLVLGCAISLAVRASKTTNNLSTLLFIKQGNKDEEQLTLAQKQRLAQLRGKERLYESSMKEYHNLGSLAVLFLHALQIAVFAYLAIFILSKLDNSIASYIKMVPRSTETTFMLSFLLSMFVGPLLTCLLLFFKRPKNNWLLFLLDILNMGVVFGVQFVFVTFLG